MQKVDVEASPVGKCIPDDCKALNIAAFVKDAQGNYITLHIAGKAAPLQNLTFSWDCSALSMLHLTSSNVGQCQTD